MSTAGKIFISFPAHLRVPAELVRKCHQLIIVTTKAASGAASTVLINLESSPFGWPAFSPATMLRSRLYISARIIRPTLLHRISKTATAGNLIPECCFRAARDLNIDLTQSVLIGDKTSDIQAAKAAGLSKAVLVQSDGTKPWTECAVPHLQTKDLLAAAKLL